MTEARVETTIRFLAKEDYEIGTTGVLTFTMSGKAAEKMQMIITDKERYGELWGYVAENMCDKWFTS